MTPVFNRANGIIQLHKSLELQSQHDFQWIIVDDGSTDNIDEIIEQFNSDMAISFIKQKNGGKCKALNTAAENCECPWFFVVDSDDYLCSNSVELILNEIKKINRDKTIVGIVGNRYFGNMCISGKPFPKGRRRIGYSELNYHYNHDGETALIFRTEHVKRFKHKVIDEENFLSEEIQYNEIDQMGDLWILDEPVIIMEYFEDGLTNNYFSRWIKNPKGTTMLFISKYNAVRKLSKIDIIIKRIKTLIQFDAVYIKSRKISMKDSPCRVLSVIFIPIALLFLFIYPDYRRR